MALFENEFTKSTASELWTIHHSSNKEILGETLHAQTHNAYTHTHTHTRARTHTHTRTHNQCDLFGLLEDLINVPHGPSGPETAGTLPEGDHRLGPNPGRRRRRPAETRLLLTSPRRCAHSESGQGSAEGD